MAEWVRQECHTLLLYLKKTCSLVLLSFKTCLSKKHVLMFLCLSKKNMSLCSSVFKHPFSCLHNKKTVRNKYSLFRTVYLPISIQLFLFCCLCGMLLYKLLLQIVRNKLVACKLGCKRSSTACQATQRDRVVA